MNNIEFKTSIPGLQEVAPPVPASQMIPDWFKNLSMHIEMPAKKPFPVIGKIAEKFNSHTIKKCPAVVDYFTEGYIIPLWSDVLIQRYGQDFHFESNLLDQSKASVVALKKVSLGSKYIVLVFISVQ